MKYHFKQRSMYLHFNKWLRMVEMYKNSRLKVAKWLCGLYNSPMRLRIKRKFAARKIQRWFRVACALRRLVNRNRRQKHEDGLVQACTNNLFSNRVIFYAWARWWYFRHILMKKLNHERFVCKKQNFKAFKLVLRTEIQ